MKKKVYLQGKDNKIMAAETTPIKRSVISYENLTQDLLDAFKEKYPHGYADYLGDIIKIDKPSGESVYAVPLEVPGAIYLVKIKVHVDNDKDVEEGFFKNSDEDDEGDDGESGEIPGSDEDFASAAAVEPDEGDDD